jgi:hypothetical protein
MKNISTYILLLIFLFSCGEKKKIDAPSTKKQIVDTTAIKSKPLQDSVLVIDSTKTIIKSEENILVKEERKETYQVKSISELWKQYKDAKALATKFITQKKLDSIIVYLNIAADAAYELSREDIATWQLNNIGYYSINEFKSKTDYDNRMQQLAIIKSVKERALYSEETKSLFQKYFNILLKAERFLHKAQMLDAELEPSERTKTIESNIQFINWVGEYISDSSRLHRNNNDE